MRVVEKFVSINGEGRKAGELAVFIRFQLCNLNCSYCDTKWANTASAVYEELSPQEIVDYVVKTGVKNATLTGGEPLLQEELLYLTQLLGENNISVEIETNGSVDISPFKNVKYPPSITLDYKSPSSNMEDKMLMSNYEYIDEGDTVKFVVGSREDLEKAKEISEKYISKSKIYFSPIFNSIEPEEIVKFMIDNNLNNVRLQLQLHKFIWEPDRKGV